MKMLQVQANTLGWMVRGLYMGLCMSLASCAYVPKNMPWRSESDRVETPLKKAKVQHIELGYSRDFIHDQLGVPQISQATQNWFKPNVSYERYQYLQSEIQILYENNSVVGYTLRNYEPRKPQIKRKYRFFAGDDPWTFSKSSFIQMSQRDQINRQFKTGQYRCRIEQSQPSKNSKHQVWLSSYHADWQPTDKPTALFMLDNTVLCPEQSKLRKECLLQLQRYVCVRGADSLG